MISVRGGIKIAGPEDVLGFRLFARLKTAPNPPQCMGVWVSWTCSGVWYNALRFRIKIAKPEYAICSRKENY